MQKDAINLYLRQPPGKVNLQRQRWLLRLMQYWPFQNLGVLEISRQLPYWGRLPLVDHRNQRILFYSPKAGCSTAIQWFLRGAGLLEEALAYDPWVHRYVAEVYPHEYSIYKELPKALLNHDFVKIKVVRNPYQRFASSFYHAFRHREHFFPGGLPKGFNMQDFLDVLENLHKPWLNPHFSLQYALWEDMVPGLLDEVLHLESMDEEIRKMNQKYGWDDPLDRKVTVLRHAAPRENMKEGNLHLWPYEDFLKKFPKDYSLFYTDANFRRRVYNFYQRDFEAYGYSADALKS